MDTKLLCLDSSIQKTGVAYFLNGTYKEHRLLDCSKEKNIDIRFKNMSIELWKAFDTYKPNIIYVEETVVLRNAQTQRFLTRLQGVVYAWCMNHDCDFNTIRPTSWRAAIGIKQNKNIKREQLKQQAMQYVLDKYSLEIGDDEAESICIGDAVLKMFGDANV